MGISIAQLRLTDKGMENHPKSYIDTGDLINIMFIYTNLLNKTFPIKEVYSETFYDNCIDSMSLDEKSKEYLTGLNDYRKDFDEFPFSDFEKFNNITVEDIEKYLEEYKRYDDFGFVGGLRPTGYDNKILYEFTKEYGLREDESIEEKLQDYKDIFKDILKYCREGYIYYYVNQ